MSEQGEGTPTQAAPQAGDTLQISKAEYGQMVAANSQLRAQLDLLVRHVEQQQQAQAQQPQQKANPNMPTGDVDSMNNTQLLAYIQQQMAAPILNTVMQLAVKEELRDVKTEFKDFDNFKDQVYELASSNTSLSLRQAYLLAKSGKPAPELKEPEGAQESKSTPSSPNSQKPTTTIAPSAAANTGPVSVKEAAARALAQLNYE